MKKNNILICLICLIAMLSCNGQKSNNKTSNKQKKNEIIPKNNKDNMELNIKEIKEYLEKQKRIESDEIEYDNPHVLTDKDLELTFQIIIKSLLENGYTDKMFIDRVNEIFGLKKDNRPYNFAKYFDISCLKWEGNNFLNKVFWVDRKQYIIIDFENKIITDAFSLKEIVEINNSELKLKVPQKIVARNMYLFNDSKAHFRWLILNDEYFMRSLITTFGYYDDKELLKWVVENTEFNGNKLDELHTVFWNKRCDGTVKVNTAIFEVLDEIITPKNGYKYLDVLKDYVYHLSSRVEKIEGLPINSRCEVMARLAYFCEKYRYDEAYKNRGFFMGRLFIYDFEDLYKKEIKKNNNYNLPKFDEYLEKSKSYKDDLFREIEGG